MFCYCSFYVIAIFILFIILLCLLEPWRSHGQWINLMKSLSFVINVLICLIRQYMYGVFLYDIYLDEAKFRAEYK